MMPLAVIFDCDGVLLNSNKLKVRMFGEAALSLGFSLPTVGKFTKFVAANFGISRFRMFDELLRMTQEDDRDITREQLVSAYANLLYQSYVRCPTTPGMREVLGRLQRLEIPMYIVSGSEHDELRRMMDERRLSNLFAGIYGSPTHKAAHLTSILRRDFAEAEPKRIVFVGDAEADFRAATEVGTSFVYMRRYSTAKSRMSQLQREYGFEEVADLRDVRFGAP